MSLYSLYLDDCKWDLEYKRYIFWGGYIIHESSEDNLIKEFKNLKRNWKLSEFDPIKWTPDKKNHDYKPQRGLKSQNGFREDVLSFIASSDITLIGAFAEISKKNDTTPIIRQLLNDLSLRLQFFIQDMDRLNRTNSTGCLILGYPSTKEAKIFSDQYFSLHKSSAILESKNWHRDRPEIPIVLDKLECGLYFCFEPHSPQMQIADFIASSCLWSYKKKNNQYFNVIRPRFRQRKGNIKGAGLMNYPGNSKLVDDLLRPKHEIPQEPEGHQG